MAPETNKHKTRDRTRKWVISRNDIVACHAIVYELLACHMNDLTFALPESRKRIGEPESSCVYANRETPNQETNPSRTRDVERPIVCRPILARLFIHLDNLDAKSISRPRTLQLARQRKPAIRIPIRAPEQVGIDPMFIVDHAKLLPSRTLRESLERVLELRPDAAVGRGGAEDAILEFGAGEIAVGTEFDKHVWLTTEERCQL
jgi:hypothetical protein